MALKEEYFKKTTFFPDHCSSVYISYFQSKQVLWTKDKASDFSLNSHEASSQRGEGEGQPDHMGVAARPICKEDSYWTKGERK